MRVLVDAGRQVLNVDPQIAPSGVRAVRSRSRRAAWVGSSGCEPVDESWR